MKVDGTPLTGGYISLQAETAPIDFRKVELLNLEGCMDPRASTYTGIFRQVQPGDVPLKVGSRHSARIAPTSSEFRYVSEVGRSNWILANPPRDVSQSGVGCSRSIAEVWPLRLCGSESTHAASFRGIVAVMATIVGVCGSLRRGSFNLMLLRAIADTMPPVTWLWKSRPSARYRSMTQTWRSLRIPAPVPLKDQIAAADGLLIVTPEYNNAMPGVLKNAIDWLSRPPSDIPRVFRGRPTGIVGATPGMGGTILSQASWLPVLRVLGVMPYFEGRVIISGAAKVFDEAGHIVDARTGDRVRAYAEDCGVRPAAEK